MHANNRDGKGDAAAPSRRQTPAARQECGSPREYPYLDLSGEADEADLEEGETLLIFIARRHDTCPRGDHKSAEEHRGGGESS